ncbi:MAG: hypothetical protein AWU59_692 [Methanolobus sp. T82-4]|jgi:hypothetical protein|nr:MAG: hypothetical protein AWU59_692 [Methanolobus sp. T82-4]
MDSTNETTRILEDVKINMKLKLSALWATVMFLYLYVDFFYFYAPGEIEHIIVGNLGPFPVTQTSLLTAMLLMTIPALMVFLSVALPAKTNRLKNIIVGILYIVVVIGSAIGESWFFYIFGSVVEFLLLLLIVGFAWKWPKLEA